MVELDLSFCTLQEYEAGQDERIMEHDLTIDLVVNIMYALAAGPQEAAIVPARITKLQPKAVGRRVLFATLDQDLQPTAYINANFCNGYLDANATRTHVSGQVVVGAYFRGYDEGLDDLLSLIGALELSAAV